MADRSYLAEDAAIIVEHLRANGFADDNGIRQVLALAEEVGEFVGAYRRHAGLARRSGTAVEMQAELADVVITAYVTAEELGFDLDQAIADKLEIIYSRGWREASNG